MKKLIQYHTVMADVNHFWTNVRVGSALHMGEIKTWEEYLDCCQLHGVSPYNKEVFDEFIGKPVEPDVTESVFTALKTINPELQKLDKLAKDVGYSNYIDYVNAKVYKTAHNVDIENLKVEVAQLVSKVLKSAGYLRSLSHATELVDSLMEAQDGGEDAIGELEGHVKEICNPVVPVKQHPNMADFFEGDRDKKR